jgi:hypothetical protein
MVFCGLWLFPKLLKSWRFIVSEIWGLVLSHITKMTLYCVFKTNIHHYVLAFAAGLARPITQFIFTMFG